MTSFDTGFSLTSSGLDRTLKVSSATFLVISSRLFEGVNHIQYTYIL